MSSTSCRRQALRCVANPRERLRKGLRKSLHTNGIASNVFSECPAMHSVIPEQAFLLFFVAIKVLRLIMTIK